MKDGRTHLAHKAEHAVDLETGAIVAVTVQGADQGDTTTIAETVTTAAEELEAVADVDRRRDRGDRRGRGRQGVPQQSGAGGPGGARPADLHRRAGSRPPQLEQKAPAARDAVYANRRRIRGARGRALLRQRSERLERPNAHLYETGGLRRTHLRGHANILKRLLVHVGGFNLGLLMRTLFGVGTPRGLQGRLAASSRSWSRAGRGPTTVRTTTRRSAVIEGTFRPSPTRARARHRVNGTSFNHGLLAARG